MLLRITAEVKGDIVLKKSISSQFYIYTFKIFKKDNSIFLSVEKKVSGCFDSMPKTSVDKLNNIHVSIPDSSIYEDMIEWIKWIEAFGSFNLGVKKILYEEAEITWIPESKEEEKLLAITSYRVTKAKQRNHTIDVSNFQDTLLYCKKLSENYVPYTYYRLGASFFDEGEYYLSYINFFLMIEYLFANGKSREDLMRKEFEKSSVLIFSIIKAIKTIPQDNPNIEWLQKECRNRQKNYNVDGVIYVLIQIRGIIAHGIKKTTGKYRKDQQLLRPICFILGMICRSVCELLQMLFMVPDDQKESFLKMKIHELGPLS